MTSFSVKLRIDKLIRVKVNLLSSTKINFKIMFQNYKFIFSPLKTTDDAMGDEDDEEETDAIVSQVLDELGLQLADQMTGLSVPTGSLTVPAKEGKTAVAAGAAGPVSDADADLQARLDNLRKE
jgi:hypothetical protein